MTAHVRQRHQCDCDGAIPCISADPKPRPAQAERSLGRDEFGSTRRLYVIPIGEAQPIMHLITAIRGGGLERAQDLYPSETNCAQSLRHGTRQLDTRALRSHEDARARPAEESHSSYPAVQHLRKQLTGRKTYLQSCSADGLAGGAGPGTWWNLSASRLRSIGLSESKHSLDTSTKPDRKPHEATTQRRGLLVLHHRVRLLQQARRVARSLGQRALQSSYRTTISVCQQKRHDL